VCSSDLEERIHGGRESSSPTFKEKKGLVGFVSTKGGEKGVATRKGLSIFALKKGDGLAKEKEYTCMGAL